VSPSIPLLRLRFLTLEPVCTNEMDRQHPLQPIVLASLLWSFAFFIFPGIAP
jgi:hypothetical protein